MVEPPPPQPTLSATRPRAPVWLRAARAWAVTLVAALLPFETLASTPVGPVRMTLLEAALLLVAATQLLALVRQPRVARSWRSPEAWLVALLASVAASAALAPTLEGVAWRGAARLGLGGLLAWAALRTCAAPPPGWRPRRVAVALVGAACVTAALGLAAHHRPEWLGLEAALQAFRPKATLAGGWRRLTGTFQHANLAGAYLAAALPLAAALVAPRRGDAGSPGLPLGASPGVAPAAHPGLRAAVQTLVAAGATLLVLSALVATGSRGGLVAGVGATALVLALDASGRWVGLRWMTRRWAWLLLALALALALHPGARHRFGLPPTGPAYSANIVPASAPASGTAMVRVENRGWLAWRALGTDPVRLVVDAVDERGAVLASRRTALPHRVDPGQAVDVRAATPPGVRLRWRLEQHGWAPLPGAAWTGPALTTDPAAVAPTRLRSERPAAGRADLWPLAVSLWRERPYLGHGPDTFRERWPERAPHLRADTRMHANQLALELLADVGLLGAVAFFALCLAALAPWSPRRWRAQLQRASAEHGAAQPAADTGARAAVEPLGVVFACAAAAWLLHGLVDCALFFHGPAGIFWLSLGVAAHHRRR